MSGGPGPRAAVLLVLLALTSGVLIAGCGESERDSAEAARADSSAAGYAVGPRSATPVARAEPPRDTSRPSAARAVPIATPAGAGPAIVAVRPNVDNPGALAGNRGGAKSGGTRSAPADTVRKVTTAVKGTPDVTVSTAKPDSVKAPPVPAGPVRVNEFLTYDSRTRTISLQLVAGYNGLNGSLNYNGATSGSHGIAVPIGWRIHVAVVNRDSDLQHSAIVLREVLPPPIEPTEPAFSGAALPDLGEGLQDGDTGTLDFIADQAGQFMIACGVPGHAQAGMWLKLVVAKGLEVPTYR